MLFLSILTSDVHAARQGSKTPGLGLGPGWVWVLTTYFSGSGSSKLDPLQVWFRALPVPVFGLFCFALCFDLQQTMHQFFNVHHLVAAAHTITLGTRILFLYSFSRILKFLFMKNCRCASSCMSILGEAKRDHFI